MYRRQRNTSQSNEGHGTPNDETNAGRPIQPYMQRTQGDTSQNSHVEEAPPEPMDIDGDEVAVNGNSQRCIICEDEPKDATIVHDNTGHVCCCLSCAYTLQKRGDSCPICRASIDRVIKHFTS